MSMKPHKDFIRDGKRNKGYSIRVGDRVPVNSANLSYVHSEPVSPEKNILLEDLSSQILENGLSNHIERDYLVFPDGSHLLETEGGQSIFPTDSVVVTDEFTLRRHRQDSPRPVFYRMELRGRFDARGAQVLPYVSGYSEQTVQDAIRFEDVPVERRNALVYLGGNIQIEANGQSLQSDQVFKVQLIREENFMYRIVIYSNFQGRDGNVFRVSYPAYSEVTRTSELQEEVLNAEPFFAQVTNREFDDIIRDMEENPTLFQHTKVFTFREVDGGYQFYATADVMIADFNTRRPQLFRYRAEANLRTRLSETNPGFTNIGFVVSQNAFGVENLTASGKALNENELLPEYLELINPHLTDPSFIKRDVRYWEVNLNMAEHLYEDYDVIVITGYGEMDLSIHRDKLATYLNNGGVIWMDNAGSGPNVFRPQGFVSDIGFSSSQTEHGVKQLENESPYFSRLYVINNIDEVGHRNTSPVILFGNNENEELWLVLARHLNGGPSIMERSFNGKGKVVVSNCGVFRGLHHSQEISTHFILNFILHHAENQWVSTPWRNEFVYHRDNLFLNEYRVNGVDRYINDRSSHDRNMIVAKKILSSSMEEYVRPFVRESFFASTGTYYGVVDGDREIQVNNSNFESGSSDGSGGAITEWAHGVTNAIPNWSTRRLGGTEAAVFNHQSTLSPFGVRHISLTTTNSQAFWESGLIHLPTEDYKISAWIKTESVVGVVTDGAKVGIYDLAGNKIADSTAVTLTRDWTYVSAVFQLQQPKDIHIRLGFVDGNGAGTVHFDKVLLETSSSVRATAPNTGEKPLYVYATRPNPTTIDITANGFENASVAIITPEIPYSYTITPFVMQWRSFYIDEITGEDIGRYERLYGNSVSYSGRVRKSDGLVNLGYLHSLLPPTPAGREWHDQNQIFYKITLGSATTPESDLVNLKLFDRKTGREWFRQNDFVIGFKDIFWATIDPSFILHVETKFETIRASKRNFGLKLLNNRRIYCELPRTRDAKENWYLRIHNGNFNKDEISYKEWYEIYSNASSEIIERYQDRVMRNERYETRGYYDQIFTPSLGLMTVENEVEYLSPTRVRLPHNNLHIRQGTVRMEELQPDGLITSYNMMPYGYDSFEMIRTGATAGRIITPDTFSEVVEDESYFGNKSLRISGTNTTKKVAFDIPAEVSQSTLPDVFFIDAGDDYVFSFYIRTEDTGMEVMTVLESDEGSQFVSDRVYVSEDWIRVEQYIEIPTDATSVVMMVDVRGTGSVFIDGMQFENI